MLRQQIIKMLDVPFLTTDVHSPYMKLKYSLTTEDDKDIIDDWFNGVIKSLYYRPNHTVLVMEGDTRDCTFFLEELFPQKEMFGTCFGKDINGEIYNKLILNTGFFKNTLNMASQDNFIVKDGKPYPYAEKRLASYCTTEPKWPYPPRKNFLVINISEIDWPLYKSISKFLLWVEVFQKFKN